MPYELAALGAALCWSVTGIIATGTTRYLGGIAFNRIRMTVIFVVMLCWVLASGGFASIPQDQWAVVMASGLIGIFIGDTALFTAMARLGPRRTGILFGLHAPITVIIVWLWFGDGLSWLELFGCALVMTGVIIAIGYRGGQNQSHKLETVHGSLAVGVALGLFAALCQAVGALMNKPALAAGADPVALTTVRIGVGAAALLVSRLLPINALRARNPMNLKSFVEILITGMLGMALAMSLLLYAFGAGNAGIAAVLSSTAPVLILPLLWLVTRQRPSAMAWVGAFTCLVGTTLLFV